MEIENTSQLNSSALFLLLFLIVPLPLFSAFLTSTPPCFLSFLLLEGHCGEGRCQPDLVDSRGDLTPICPGTDPLLQNTCPTPVFRAITAWEAACLILSQEHDWATCPGYSSGATVDVRSESILTVLRNNLQGSWGMHGFDLQAALKWCI